MAVVAVLESILIDKLMGIGTMSFSVAGNSPITVYTYTYATGRITASAIGGGGYEITLINYVTLVRVLTKWLYDCDQLLGQLTYPTTDSWKVDFEVNRAAGRATMTAHVCGPKLADLEWGIVGGSGGTVKIKGRPAIDLDRGTFAIFQASHEHFAAICERLGNMLP